MIHLGLQSGLKTTIASVTRHPPEREVLLPLSVDTDTVPPYLRKTLAGKPADNIREDIHSKPRILEPQIP